MIQLSTYNNNKILHLLKGSGVHNSEVIQGMVFKREVEGNITKVKDAKIAVFSCPLDSMATETKVSLKYRTGVLNTKLKNCRPNCWQLRILTFITFIPVFSFHFLGNCAYQKCCRAKGIQSWGRGFIR